jgi:hypothetical protein
MATYRSLLPKKNSRTYITIFHGYQRIVVVSRFVVIDKPAKVCGIRDKKGFRLAVPALARQLPNSAHLAQFYL